MTTRDAEAQVLVAGLQELGLAADAQSVARLQAYLDLLERWSSAFNLVGTRDRGEIVSRHVLDCAAVVAQLPSGAVLDVGSGAGLPGLVVALLQPERQVILLDSAQRKTRFLRQAALELQLGGVEVVTGRVEDYAAERSGTAVPVAITARAVAPLVRLVGWLEHLITDTVPLLAMKGPAWKDEARALAEQDFDVQATAYSISAAPRDHVIVRVLRRQRP